MCEQAKTTKKQHNGREHDAQTMSHKVLIVAPPQLCRQHEQDRGERGYFHRLAFLRTYNNFQPIKEVIKHTQHREGVSLMRSARSGTLHLPECLICFPIPPLLFPLRPN